MAKGLLLQGPKVNQGPAGHQIRALSSFSLLHFSFSLEWLAASAFPTGLGAVSACCYRAVRARVAARRASGTHT